MLHRGHLVCIKSAPLKWNRTRDKRWERIQKSTEFRSHTTSIQSWDRFKADTSQLIYLRGHFSSEESLTAGEEHARYTLADGHPLALKRNLNEFLQYQFYRLRTRNGIQLSNIASIIWRESLDLDGDNERRTEGIVSQTVYKKLPRAFVWKAFQSVKPPGNKNTLTTVEGRERERGLFILIGTVGHRKQKQRSSHSPFGIHPKAHIHPLYSPAIKIRLGNKIQKHFWRGIRELSWK